MCFCTAFATGLEALICIMMETIRPGYYGVYVRVMAFQSWILTTLLARVSGGEPVAPCPGDEFTCGGGAVTCVPRKWVCDGFIECENGADEESFICDTTIQVRVSIAHTILTY